MKNNPSIRSLAAMATIALGLALAVPGVAVAGEYEEALAVVESVVGPIGDTNDAEAGGVDFSIIGLALEAKDAKAGGDEALALAIMLKAEAMAVSTE